MMMARNKERKARKSVIVLAMKWKRGMREGMLVCGRSLEWILVKESWSEREIEEAWRGSGDMDVGTC